MAMINIRFYLSLMCVCSFAATTHAYSIGTAFTVPCHERITANSLNLFYSSMTWGNVPIPKDDVSRRIRSSFSEQFSERFLVDGRVVIYTGDDQRGDYLYKFVSRDAYDANTPNPDLLDHGTLYVAQFNDTEVEWLPLTYGHGPLTAENGFASQADVLIDTRLAADALGATSMDRPEDVQPNKHSGQVYVMLTNNKKRSDAIDAPLRTALNAANPRAKNTFGHIIEITEPDGNFASTSSRWDFLVKCGDPNDPNFGAVWNPLTSNNGWFSAPDNCAIDPTGGMWVATDGNANSGAADGLWAMETRGEKRGTGRAFFRAPVGAEVCGPSFSNDGQRRSHRMIPPSHPGYTCEGTVAARD